MKHEGLQIGHRMAEVAADHAGEEWKEMAFEAFKRHAMLHSTFTTEQVRRWNPDIPVPPDGRAWGQIALRAKKEKVVSADSWVRADNRSVHGMAVTLWRSNIKRNAACHACADDIRARGEK